MDPSYLGPRGVRRKPGPRACGSKGLGVVFLRILRFYDAPGCTQYECEYNRRRCTAVGSRPELEGSRGVGLFGGLYPCVSLCGIVSCSSAAGCAAYAGQRGCAAVHPGETVAEPSHCQVEGQGCRCRSSSR